MGVTVEHEAFKNRIQDLRMTGAFIKFLSLEPLLSSIPDLNLFGIDWVIAGGESGPQARLMEKEWVVVVRDQCRKAEIPFFFKQWGGKNKKTAGCLLNGKMYKEMPRWTALETASTFSP